MQKRQFLNRDWPSDDFGLRIPVIQKTFYRKCATFIVERVSIAHVVDRSCNLPPNSAALIVIKWLVKACGGAQDAQRPPETSPSNEQRNARTRKMKGRIESRSTKSTARTVTLLIFTLSCVPCSIVVAVVYVYEKSNRPVAPRQPLRR